MLVSKGSHVGFKLAGKTRKKIWCPARAGMLHDPSGDSWPKCSVLVACYERGRKKPSREQYQGAPRDYLGRQYQARVGSIALPPRDLDQWQEIGELEEIYYLRPGTKAPGKYRHKFNAPRGMYRIMFLFKGRGDARLYKLDRMYRIEVERCIIDDRGFVYS